MWIERTAVAAAIALAMSGCATLQDHPTACKVGATLLGATVGAVGGGVGVFNIEKGPDNGEIAAGASVGLVAGGLIGYLIGHYACPEPEPVVAPPPPPVRTPPPPPTERRGG